MTDFSGDISLLLTFDQNCFLQTVHFINTVNNYTLNFRLLTGYSTLNIHINAHCSYQMTKIKMYIITGDKPRLFVSCGL